MRLGDQYSVIFADYAAHFFGQCSVIESGNDKNKKKKLETE